MSIEYVPIIYSGRSRSTLLYKLLEQHPEVISLNEVYDQYRHRGELFDLHYKTFLKPVNTFIRNEKLKNNNFKNIKNVTFQWSFNDTVIFLSSPVNFNIFFKFMSENFNKLIFLRRKNYLKQIVSFEKADQSKIWHAEKIHSLEKKKIKLNTCMSNNTLLFKGSIVNINREYTDLSLLNYMRLFKEEQEFILQTARNHIPNMLELVYEDDIEFDHIPLINKVTEYLNISKEVVYDVPLKKISNGLREDLLNYEEVHNHLKGTEFEWMME